MEERRGVDVDQFRGPVSEGAFGGGVEGLDLSVRTGGDDGIIGAVQDGLLENGQLPQAGLAFPNDPLGLLDLADIPDRDQIRRPRSEGDPCSQTLDPAFPSLGRYHLVAIQVAAPALTDIQQIRGHDRDEIGMNEFRGVAADARRGAFQLDQIGRRLIGEENYAVPVQNEQGVQHMIHDAVEKGFRNHQVWIGQGSVFFRFRHTFVLKDRERTAVPHAPERGKKPVLQEIRLYLTPL
ncbi:MAG: hypothetical protein BWX98_02393 [Candidatus Aminicenantes bacterium ADurb.Bin147]|nr:MAG: hypothetical protein BWX98_02393 [Candidatus Aminicenantes bacterium ADurb.Bin147]